MKNLVTDIKALQEETLKNLQSSKATNTVRAYKSDFKDFGLFCAQNGFKNSIFVFNPSLYKKCKIKHN